MVTFSGLTHDDVSPVSARLQATTDSSVAASVDWGTESHDLSNAVGPTASGTSHTVYLRHLPLNKTIYYRWRSGSDLSGVQAFEVLEPKMLHSVNAPTPVDSLSCPVFTDCMKQCRPWMTSAYAEHGPALPVDGDGWPTDVSGGLARTILFPDLGGRYPGGEYLLEWDGTGTVAVGLDAVVSSSGSNFIRFTVPNRSGGFTIDITATNAAPNNVRNVRCWLPGYHQSSQLFTDEYLALFKNAAGTTWARSARMLEWTHANSHDERKLDNPGGIAISGSETRLIFSSRGGHGFGSSGTVEIQLWGVFGNTPALDGFHTATIIDADTLELNVTTTAVGSGGAAYPKTLDWADRVQPTFYCHATKRGAALEHMIDMCNALGSNLHIPAPVQCTDDWHREAAKLVKSRLNSGLVVKIEHNNENWNSQFPGEHYSRLMGALRSYSGNEFEQRNRYHGARTEEIGDIWRAELGERVVVVLGTQLAGPGNTQQAAAQLSSNSKVDELALNLYFAEYLGSPANGPTTKTWSEDQILDECRRHIQDAASGGPGGEAGVRRMLADHRPEWETRGWAAVGYEGGQHLVGFFGQENDDDLTTKLTGTNRNPRMYDQHANLVIEAEAAGLKELAWFLLCGKYVKWGSWGLVEYYDNDPPAEGGKLSLAQEVGAHFSTPGGPGPGPSGRPLKGPSFLLTFATG